MPSQAPAYGALLVGGVALVAAVKGAKFTDVLAGRKSPIRPLTTSLPTSFEHPTGSSGGTSAGAGASPSGAGGVPPKSVPQSQRAAKAAAGLGTFDGHQVALWIIPYLKYARAHGWTGHVESGYRSEAEQERIYNSGVRPAAVPGTSNHEGKKFPRGAIDVSEAAQLSAILEKLPGGSLLKWAGSADPVHFSFPHGGGY